MRVTKPIKLSLLHRTYQYRGENHFAASMFTMFSLTEPERVYPENELWQILASVLGRDGMLDAAMPKARAEYVVLGSFHAPGGKKVPAGEASVRIGGLKKRLNIYGDRYWKKLAGVAVAHPHRRADVKPPLCGLCNHHRCRSSRCRTPGRLL